VIFWQGAKRVDGSRMAVQGQQFAKGHPLSGSVLRREMKCNNRITWEYAFFLEVTMSRW
jgi:hypothetical protein